MQKRRESGCYEAKIKDSYTYSAVEDQTTI